MNMPGTFSAPESQFSTHEHVAAQPSYSEEFNINISHFLCIFLPINILQVVLLSSLTPLLLTDIRWRNKLQESDE
jgi:hypothetical protein